MYSFWHIHAGTGYLTTTTIEPWKVQTVNVGKSLELTGAAEKRSLRHLVARAEARVAGGRHGGDGEDVDGGGVLGQVHRRAIGIGADDSVAAALFHQRAGVRKVVIRRAPARWGEGASVKLDLPFLVRLTPFDVLVRYDIISADVISFPFLSYDDVILSFTLWRYHVICSLKNLLISFRFYIITLNTCCIKSWRAFILLFYIFFLLRSDCHKPAAFLLFGREREPENDGGCRVICVDAWGCERLMVAVFSLI